MNFGGYTTILLLGTYDPRGKTVRVGLPGVSSRKRQSSQTSGGITAIRSSNTKVGSRSLRFCRGLAVHQGMDTICTVVDKTTKKCHFLPYSESISAKTSCKVVLAACRENTWNPSVLKSDCDPCFTSKCWKKLWRLLGTNMPMGSGFHPESSGQVQRFNQLLEKILYCPVHQLGDA